MSASSLPPPSSAAAAPTHAVLEQAATWYACLRDGQASAAEQAAWRAWVNAAESHGTAWRYVEDISRAFTPLQHLPDPHNAAQQLHAANERLHRRRRVLAGVVLLGSGSLLGTMSWQRAWLPDGLLAWNADHRTATGEQRQMQLADGTRLWLNTATAVNVEFTPDARRVMLLSGEIFIDTAPDNTRPFLVETRQGRLRALGTRFNVRRDDDSTALSVYEGAVEIHTATTQARAVIEAGQQTHFTSHQIALAEPADNARAAWTQGTLVADNLPLHEVIRELRRYRPGHLGVADEVADLTVYGNFPIHDTDRVLRMLGTALPIRVTQPLPWWTTVGARP